MLKDKIYQKNNILLKEWLVYAQQVK